MSRQPKDGATEWNLKVEHVPIELYWQFHAKANSEHMEFGKWVIKVLSEASQPNAKAKRTKP